MRRYGRELHDQHVAVTRYWLVTAVVVRPGNAARAGSCKLAISRRATTSQMPEEAKDQKSKTKGAKGERGIGMEGPVRDERDLLLCRWWRAGRLVELCLGSSFRRLHVQEDGSVCLDELGKCRPWRASMCRSALPGWIESQSCQRNIGA